MKPKKQNSLKARLLTIVALLTTPFRKHDGKSQVEPSTDAKPQLPAPAYARSLPASDKPKDEVYWCFHPRHTSPVPRNFLTKGRTDRGNLFSVFECSDPDCRTFVAAFLKHSDPHGHRIIFRGKKYSQETHLRRRTDNRPKPIVCAARTAAVVMLAVTLVGCGRDYKTELGSEETISTTSTVQMDGHRIEGGRVKKITTDKTGRRMAEFTTGNEVLRRGTFRVTADNAIDLRTDQATQEVLPSGALIPVQSNLAYLAKQWSGKTLTLLGLAAVVAVVAFQRFLALQALRPVLPIVAAVGLAAITSYAGHQFLVPVIQDFQSNVHPVSPPELSEASAATASGSWVDKLRGTEKEVTNFLRTPSDCARLLAFLSVFVISLPLFACLISWLFRKLAPSAVLCCALLLATPIVLNATPGGIYYDLAALKEEQRAIGETIAEAERNLNTATHLLDSTLAGAPERIIHALFLSDLAAIRIENEPNRIAQLKGSFGRIKSEEQKKLTAVYINLQQRIQRIQLDAAKLSDGVNRATNAQTALKIFQSRQADYRNQIRGGFEDPKLVVDECNRHLAAAFGADAAAKTSETEKSVAEIAKLHAQVAELRRARESSSTAPLPATIIITNEVRTIVEKLVPSAVPAPEIRYVTNTVRAEEKTNNSVQAVDASSETESSSNETQIANVPAIAPQENGGGPMSAAIGKPRVNIALLGGVVAGVIALCAVAWFLYLSSLRGTPYAISLAGSSGRPDPFDVNAIDDALCLQTPPVCESINNLNGGPHIVVTWRGPVLRPGTHAVRVNELLVTREQKLFPGDCIVIEGENPQQFTFLGCDPVSAGLTAEAQS